jgi:two-component system chemotaxis response regulator CheY
MGRILVIDDSPTVASTIRELLSLDGHIIDCLNFFIDLPRIVREETPDLVLLDLEMPIASRSAAAGHSGVAFARYIRKHEPHPIAILIHSSRPLPDLEKAARDVRAVGVLPKGSAPSEVRRAVTSALQKARVSR